MQNSARANTSELHRLVARNLAEFQPTYADGLTNHLPMCLIALNRLGASDADLQRFFDHYSRQLKPRVKGASTARETMLRPTSELLEGLAGAGFHGLIRLSYALELGLLDEIDAASLYFDATATRLVPSEPALEGSPSKFRELATRLGAMPQLERVSGRTLFERLHAVAKQRAFMPLARELWPYPSLLAELSLFGAELYLATSSFLALHVLTASHALRRIHELDSSLEASAGTRALGIAALAAYGVLGCPVLGGDARPVSDVASERPSWDDMRERAIRSLDDHLAKLIFSCIAEENHYRPHNSVYRTIALRASLAGEA